MFYMKKSKENVNHNPFLLNIKIDKLFLFFLHFAVQF